MEARTGTYYDAFDRLMPILFDVDNDATVYVYRRDATGKVIHPYLLKCPVWPDLLETLRDDYGGGRFRIMIRKGRTMIYTGDISIIEGFSFRGV
jgi:hypothetical protein